jgi:hypothetical protein
LVKNFFKESTMKHIIAFLLVLSAALPFQAAAEQVGAAYQVYRMPSSGSIPKFGSVSLDQGAAVTGTLPHGKGGTDVTSPGASGNALVSDGSNWTSSPQHSSITIRNCALATSVGSSALTISLKQADGSSAPDSGGPCAISFRDSTSANGGYSVVSTTSATTLVISSGSTLGMTSAVAGTIYVYAINNAGTIELAASRTLFDDGTVQTSTAEGGAGAADSATVLCSTTARSNKAVRLIGRLSATEATAGTWATAPSEVSLPPFTSGVTTTATGVERIERVSVGTKCTSTPCTMDVNTPGIASVTRSGTGAYAINFTAGTFSGIPTCVVTGYIRGTANGWCHPNSEGNTSGQSVACYHTETAQDDAFGAICMGAR